MATSNFPSLPFFILTDKIANHSQGIVIIPTEFSSWFGSHGAADTISMWNGETITCNVDRNNVPNLAPRISSSRIGNAFKDRYQMGSRYKVTITGQNRIKIRPFTADER